MRFSSRTLALAGAIGVLAAAAGYVVWRGPAAAPVAWRTAPLAQRDVQKVVSATGTLAADPTVDVGTQVSGIVAELLVDFNDTVEEGQVLARIDPSLLDADVAAAAARRAEAVAQRDRLALARTRVEALAANGAVTTGEREAAEADHAVAVAQARAAQVTLDRARRNQRYATIRAPIAGTVLKRAVSLGQTVNAGFSAPTLFQLAGDLSRMTILVNVDESDIGMVKPAQAVRFTVQAWPERTFEGTVRTVRLESKIDQSVVTYTAVVDAANTDGALFPGMTATVEFIVAEAKGVLCAPNAALRFTPDEGVAVVGVSAGGSGGGVAEGTPTPLAPEGPKAESVGRERAPQGDAAPGAASDRPRPRRPSSKDGREGGGPPSAPSAGGPPAGTGSGGPGGGRRKNGGASKTGTLWTVDGEALRGHPVTLGIRGAECAEVSGADLAADMALVLGVDRSAEAGGSSPFSSRSGDARRPGGF